MSFEKIVEDQIRRAIAEGKFDDLPGKGKPLDLESYFQTPEHLRLAYSVLGNGGFAPEEVQLMQDIDTAKRELQACWDEKLKAGLEKAVREKALRLSVLLEKWRR